MSHGSIQIHQRQATCDNINWRDMNISKESFISSCHLQGLTREQCESIWQTMESGQNQKSSLPQILYYLGALIIIVAMGWFATSALKLFGGIGLSFIAAIYAIILVLVGRNLWNKSEFKVPAELLIVAAVCMVPLAVYGLQNGLNLWPIDPESADYHTQIIRNWIYIDISLVLAGMVALYFFPFPFLTVPIFLSVWYICVNVETLMNNTINEINGPSWVTFFFGLILIPISYFLDRTQRKDYAFWGYLIGVCAFWVGLSLLTVDKSEPVQLAFFGVNLFMMALAAILKRNIFLILGSIGVFIYLSHLAYVVFLNYPIIFTLGLSLIGLAIIYLGMICHRRQS